MINAPNHYRFIPPVCTLPNWGNPFPSNNKLRTQGRPRPAAQVKLAISPGQLETLLSWVGPSPLADASVARKAPPGEVRGAVARGWRGDSLPPPSRAGAQGGTVLSLEPKGRGTHRPLRADPH